MKLELVDPQKKTTTTGKMGECSGMFKSDETLGKGIKLS